MWINRALTNKIVDTIKTRPAILLTGVRQSGKSSLLTRLFPKAEYVTFDRVSIAQSASENPASFLRRFENSSQVILDEIQYVPSLFRELKILIDANRDTYGKWILTGSQKFILMNQISESLAGRISILCLETLSAKELRDFQRFFDLDDILWKGGYPEIWANSKINPVQFFEDYIQSYLEKDLKELIKVSNLRDFQRFIKICASRVGQLINYVDMAKDVGISSNTAKSWINALEVSGIIVLLQPFFANIGKRLVKAPKIFFADQGLLCNLLNITGAKDLDGHIYEGSIWENFVFTELMKNPLLTPSKNLFFYRDQNGVEIDFVIERGKKILLVEAKSAEVVNFKKLNFNKIKNLLKSDVECYLLCKTEEATRLEMKDFFILNPLKCSLSF